METSKTFGERSIFAILYRVCPEQYNYELKDKMAICHLIIEGKLIGNPIEECYLPTWLFSLTNFQKFIAENIERLFPKEFEGLTDREIFETILKANQFEEEYHPDFLYLPQVSNEIWYRHRFIIDETIDGYLIYFYVKDNQITFLIEDDSASLNNNHRSYQFQFYSAPLELFYTTVEEAARFLTQRYPFLMK